MFSVSAMQSSGEVFLFVLFWVGNEGKRESDFDC